MNLNFLTGNYNCFINEVLAKRVIKHVFLLHLLS